MQNDRNVSSDDNKNAISLDNIIDEYGSTSTGKRSEGKISSNAKKKIEEMFSHEAEELAWLDDIMNGEKNISAEVGGNTQNIPTDGEIIIPTIDTDDAPELGDISDEDFIPDNSNGNFRAPASAGVIVPDLSVMPEQADFPENGMQDNADGSFEEVIKAENADEEDDDTKIFTSSANNMNITDENAEDYSEWANESGNDAPVYDNVNGQVNPIPEMMPPVDKKLKKKLLKEEKKFARAQAKAMKAQQKARKKAGFDDGNAYMYDSQMQNTPDMHEGYTSGEGQPYPEYSEAAEQNGAENYQQMNADVLYAENTQNAAVQEAPEAYVDAGQDDDVLVYAPNGENATENTMANDEVPEDIFREDQDAAYVADTAETEDDGQNVDTAEGAQGESAPDFDMFEGAAPEGEYVHNVENAAAQQGNDVNSSLGKLFGVDIPDEDDDKKGSKKKSEHKKIAKELGAYEEINMADSDAVNNARRYYFTKKRGSMIALFGAALFFLVSLYAELSMLGVFPLPDILNVRSNPTMFALADLQVMCFGAVFVIDSLIGGFYALLDKRFSPASCALTVFIACSVQAVVSAIFGAGVKTEMFCCVGCLAIFMLALYDSLRASADFKSFNIASSTANKYGAYELGVDSLECSPFASHIDLENAKVISVNKGAVYEGFVGRNEKRPEGEKKLGRLTLIITIISVLVGVFVAFFSDGNIKERIYEGITGAAIVITSSVPLNVFFVSALPKYLAVTKGNKMGATLIGQNASEEYKGLSVVTFEDTEVFLPKDVRISSIKTYGGMALDEAVITMASIYNKIGGPLSKIFAKMVDVKSMRSEVRLVKVYPDAIEVNVDGRDFCLATASYLGANGIRIINDGVDAAFEQSHGSILFMVCSGRVLSKFYIKYSMNPVFEKTLRELHDANLCIGIKTLDPCITNDLVFGCLERANYALSVIKGNSAGDIPVVRNKVNSGVISLGSVHSFLEMLLICEKTGRNVKINNVIKLISAILCIALSTVFVLTNNGSLNIIFCLLIQLFWLLPVAAVSYLNR